MNIQTKAILAVILLISCLSGMFLYMYYLGNVQSYNKNIQNLSNDIQHSFEIQRETLAGKYSERIKGFINTNTEIMDAFSDNDRDLLYKLTSSKFNILKKESKYLVEFTYLLPDGTVLLRMEKPNFYGDNVSHIPFAKHILQMRKLGTGFAITRIGAFYRIIAPVYDGDKFVGMIGWAFKVSLLAEHISKQKGVYYGILAGSKWYNKVVSLDEKKIKIGNHLLIASSVNDKVFSNLDSDFDIHKKNQILEINNSIYLIHSTVLMNFSGKHVGDILLALDISEEVALFKEHITNAIIFTVIIVLLSFLILYISFSKLIGNIEELNATLEDKVAERTKELEISLSKVKVLSGLLPICASCKKIRDDQGYWAQIEDYIGKYSDVEFSHSICPDCVEKLYPEIADKIKDKK